MTGLLGTLCSASQMTYHLRRLCLQGLIGRVDGHNRYHLNLEGQRFAVSYTKLRERVLPPLFAVDQPNTPVHLRRALAVIGRSITDHLADTGLAAARNLSQP